MAYLEAKDITKRFGGIVAVDHVSFEVEKGEIVSIIGPNGAGKTTIFNMLTGVYTIDEGDITFEGNPIHNQKPQKVVEAGISRTFQNIRLFQDLRVVENVLVGTHIKTGYSLVDSIFRTRKFRKVEDEKVYEAIQILKSIGLDGRRDDYAQNLPYGDQRKLEIARALATQPKLLLLDEPAAGMNEQETGELLEIVAKLKKMNYTVLLIEHDMKFVMNICERIYVLDNGALIADGVPEEIRASQAVIEAYLGKED